MKGEERATISHLQRKVDLAARFPDMIKLNCPRDLREASPTRGTMGLLSLKFCFKISEIDHINALVFN